MNRTEIYEAARARWIELQPLALPLKEYVVLWGGSRGQIVVDAGRGTPQGYASCTHSEGTNHGYLVTKGRPDVIDRIAEVQGWPEYAEALKLINDQATLLETIGCEKNFNEVEQDDSRYAFGARIFLGSYTDITFSDPTLRSDPLNHVRLGAYIFEKQEAFNNSANVTVALQPVGNSWNTMLHITNHGHDANHARVHWGDTIKEVARSAASFRLT